MLTENDLQQIMPRLQQAKRQLYLPFINRVMEIYEIDTPLRASAFLAQIAHESAELKYMEEIWGPTAQQKKYEIAKNVLSSEEADDFAFSTPLAPSSESEAIDDSPVLPRGQESIEPDSTTLTDSQDETNPAVKKPSSRGLGSRLRNWFR